MIDNIATNFPPQTYSSSFVLNVITDNDVQSNSPKKRDNNEETSNAVLDCFISTNTLNLGSIILLIVVIRHSASQSYDCIESHSPTTRKFTTIHEYQTNNLRFNSKYNFVEFTAKLGKLENNMFVTYDSNFVRKLTLADMAITSVDKGAFNELYCVRYLLLQNNSIPRVQNGTFTGLHSVEELDLSRNQIESVPRSSFFGLKYLLKLDMSFNKISYVSELAFDSLMSLWEVNLRHNSISELASDLFLQTKHLRRLFLGFNSISMPTTFDFKHLPKLDILDISNNNIFKIPNTFFDNLANLTDLNLSGNLLTDLNITSLPKLTRLNIQKNQFQCSKLQKLLIQLEDLDIGVVVNLNTELRNVNVKSVGCYNGRVPVVPTVAPKPRTEPHLTTEQMPDVTPVTAIPGTDVVNDNVILDAVNGLKTMLVIFIIVLVLFHVIDVVLRTHTCTRLRQRQRLYPFPVGRGNDASLPLLNR